MKTTVRSTVVAGAALALVAAGSSTVSATDASPAAASVATDAAAISAGGPSVKKPQASTRIACEKDSSGQDGDDYDGESAGYLYDRRFDAGPVLPDAVFAHHVPQGVVVWESWKDDQDLLLVSAHNDGDTDGRIFGIDQQSGELEGSVAIGRTHAGALGIDRENGWLFVDGAKDAGWHTIYTYDLDQIREALSSDDDTSDNPTPAEQTRRVYGASFLTVSGSKLYSGLFNPDSRDWMYRYTINEQTGELTTDQKPGTSRGLRWEIPSGTQGVAKSGDTFLFSTSKGRKVRSNIYATNASETNLDKASVRCFRAPSMAEGISVSSTGTVQLMFESGAEPYASDEQTRNVIAGAHTTDIDRLTGIPGGRIQLGTLHAKAQEDFFGEDEISIKIEGENILDKHIDIEEGQRKKVRHQTVQFTGNARVSLTELDPEGDDNLGTRKIGPEADHAIVRFAADDAVYRLSYTVR